MNGEERLNTASLTDGNRRKRTASACLQCQKRKIRCDGAMPACNHCTRQSTSCIYAERRRRGRGKRKDYVQLLEERVKKVESLLQEQSAQSTAANDEEMEHDMLQDSVNFPESSQGYSVAGSQAYNDLGAGALTKDNSPLVAFEAAPESAQSDLARQLMLKFTEYTADMNMNAQNIQASMDRECFRRRVFVQPPPQQHTIDMILPVVENVHLHGVLITETSFRALLDQHYAAGSDNRVEDPSGWVVVNSLFASAVLHRMDNGALENMSPIAWSYFKNAFATFPELIIQGAEISACEALLVMAMFMLSTSDLRTASQLAAAAARLAHGLGLHRRDHYVSLDSVIAERHKRVFWTTYMLNTDITHKLSLPSPFSLGAAAVGFPEDGSSTETAEFFRQMAELSIIQLRIHKLVLLDETSKRSNSEVVDALTGTYHEILAWKDALPEESQPGCETSMEVLEMPLASLHFKYYSSVAKIHMAVAILIESETFGTTDTLSVRASQTYSNGKEAKAMCATTARRMIRMLRHLSLRPLSQLWEMMSYPLSAALILLSTILADPTAHQTRNDVEIIGEFVQFLEKLQADGCDVRKPIDGCVKLQKIAECAVDAYKTGEQSLVLGQTIFGDAIRAQLERVYSKLSRVTDWLKLAEGLLSNISMLRAEAEDVLSEILGVNSTDGIYGPFVPEFLKSCNYNFSFGL